MVNQFEAYLDLSWLQRTLSHVARFAGTELGFLDDDAELAECGGAFLFAPSDRDVQHARTVFARHPPVYVRRYLGIAIERIVEAAA